jgi:hypothetical protein
MTGEPPPSRALRRALSVLFGVLAGAVTIPAVQGVPTAAGTPSEEPTPAPPYVTGGDIPKPLIRYEVSGPGLAGYITYQTNNGQAHEANVALPWSTQLTGKMGNRAHINAYSVSATGVGPGSISCTMSVNGKVVSQYTATGNPARVVCAQH